MLLIDELLNVDFDKHCRDCPYNTKDFSKRFTDYLDRIDFTKVISNDKISNDLETLQKHYTILLDFCYDLMNKNDETIEKMEILERNLYWKNEKIESLLKQKESLERQIDNIIKLNVTRRKENKNGIRNKT